MTVLVVIFAFIAAILTLWLIAVPAEIVVGAFSAFRHGGHGWDAWKKQ